MDAARAAHLLEANQQLVLAVIRAQDEAATAAQALRDLSRSPRIEALTEQPDGALLFDRLTHALAVARRKGDRLGLLFVSVDNLKDINDTLGHARGDQVLKLVAQRLAAAVRGSDTVSRHGGHEFLILLTALSHARDALALADSIVAAMALPGQVGSQKVTLKVSIGISVFPDDGDDGDALIDRATAAMYNARRRGLGSYFFRGEAATKERSLELRTAESLQQIDVPAAEDGDPGTASHRKEVNEQLLLAALHTQELLDAAELAYRRQAELMGVVAHELRGPLGPITMAASLLGKSKTPESTMPMVKGVIERQVALMARLVGDLLDMTRINTGKLRLDIQRVDVARVIDDVVSDLRPALEARLQQLRIELPTRRVHSQWRPAAPGPGDHQPAGQRVQIYPARRDHHVLSRPRERRSADHQRGRQRHRDQRPGARACFRSFRAGTARDFVRRLRPGDRSQPGARIGAGAWRPGDRRERRPGPG